MNRPVAPAARRYGHETLPRDSAGAVDWICQHAQAHGFELDAAQNRALHHFERLYDDLIGLERLESRLIRLLARRRIVRGIYLWGPVGRGKSFLMDSFFNCAPVTKKNRTHFHGFMRDIHRQLAVRQGEADPLVAIAHDIAQDARLLCLDEFHITDIGDAMVMRRLLEGLFDNGTVLVTTSNVRPDDLYLHGLQRSQFVPAIELIKRHLDVVAVDGDTDYRLRTLENAGVYHVNGDAGALLERTFADIARHTPGPAVALDVEGRTITAVHEARGVAWFEFSELCGGPRSKNDYIDLARRYHTVIVSGVPRFGPQDRDAMRRFIWLVDVFYDQRVKLIVAAAAPAEQLYPDARPGSEFERTVSRLIEMQSREYLSQPHVG